MDQRLLDILTCPLCPDYLPLVSDGDMLTCPACGHRFPVIDGIPDLTAREPDGLEPA